MKEPAGEPMDAISLNTTNNIWYTSIKLMEKQISVFACSFSIPWPLHFPHNFEQKYAILSSTGGQQILTTFTGDAAVLCRYMYTTLQHFVFDVIELC